MGLKKLLINLERYVSKPTNIKMKLTRKIKNNFFNSKLTLD